MDDKTTKEAFKKLREMDDRPVQSMRMVGNRRVEVWFLGDFEPMRFDLGGATGGASAAEPAKKPAGGTGLAEERSQDLASMKVLELQSLARKLGVKYAGLRKAALIKAIAEASK